MGKRILITGSTSGLGLSHAIFLHHKGYEVMGVARSIPDLEILKQRFQTDNSQYALSDKKVKRKKSLVPDNISQDLDSILQDIDFQVCDVTDQKSLDSFFSYLETQWDTMDYLVNNAGFGLFGSILQFDLEKERGQYEVNVLSTLEMIRRSTPYLIQADSPKIINTSSLAAYFGIPFQGHYSSSKAAVYNMTESLRHELYSLGIQVCTIDPGDINTSFNARSASEIANDTPDMLDLERLKRSISDLPLPDYLSEEQKEKIMRREGEVWKQIVNNLVLAPPPLVVSKKLEKILRKRKLKPHYKVGSKFQVLAISIAQRIFTENFSNYLMGKFYGL